jgi:inorganic pyrophosphatase
VPWPGLTGCVGDADPIDVVELSAAPLPMGAVRRVKVLGCLAMHRVLWPFFGGKGFKRSLSAIDEGETDWKIIAIDTSHPRAASLHSIDDLTAPAGVPDPPPMRRERPPAVPTDVLQLEQVRQWFRMYKTPDGKPENTFAFAGQYQGRDYALRIIAEQAPTVPMASNGHPWKILIVGGVSPMVANGPDHWCLSPRCTGVTAGYGVASYPTQRAGGCPQ